jgi:5-methylcytosine-specific restriction endonuclease McrA
MTTPKRIKPFKAKSVTKKPAVVAKVRRTSVQVYGERWDWMAVREKVLARDNHTCRKCPCKTNLQVDHIRPAARGGQTTMSNLWTLCADCHSKRPGHAAAKHLILAKKK